MISFDIVYKIIGSKIKQRREESKLTQEEIAKELNLSRASIANYESGKQRISVAELYNLAERFGIDIMDILPSLKVIKREVTPENKLDRATDIEKDAKAEIREFMKKTAGNLNGGGK